MFPISKNLSSLRNIIYLYTQLFINIQLIKPERTLPIPTRVLTHYRPAMPFGNRKNILEDLFSTTLSRLKKKYHPSGNLKFINLGIFQGLKLRILMAKILPISLELRITSNTLGCYGLTNWEENSEYSSDMTLDWRQNPVLTESEEIEKPKRNKAS